MCHSKILARFDMTRLLVLQKNGVCKSSVQRNNIYFKAKIFNVSCSMQLNEP